MYDQYPVNRVLLGSGTAQDLSATGIHTYNFVVSENARVRRLQCYVTANMSSTVAPVVTFYSRPVYGSSSNQVTLGTVVIASGAVADAVYYKDITPVNIPAGAQLVFGCTTAATTSGAAFHEVILDRDPEVPANMSKFVASA